MKRCNLSTMMGFLYIRTKYGIPPKIKSWEPKLKEVNLCAQTLPSIHKRLNKQGFIS